MKLGRHVLYCQMHRLNTGAATDDEQSPPPGLIWSA